MYRKHKMGSRIPVQATGERLINISQSAAELISTPSGERVGFASHSTAGVRHIYVRKIHKPVAHNDRQRRTSFLLCRVYAGRDSWAKV